MAYKLDIRNIVRDHFKTIVNDNTGKPDIRDWFFFLILPLSLSGILLYFKIFLKQDFIDSIISGLSIYVGLALNLIVLLFEIVQKKETTMFKVGFAKDLIANICFSILLSILTIVCSLFTTIDCGKDAQGKDIELCLTKYVFSGLTYLLVTEMVLTIILLVRSMYFQLIDQIETNKADKL